MPPPLARACDRIADGAVLPPRLGRPAGRSRSHVPSQPPPADGRIAGSADAARRRESTEEPGPRQPRAHRRPTPRQLGAAYHQVEAIQAHTLHALGDAYRRVRAAAAQLAARANHGVGRDRRIVQVGADIASRAEQGLDVARGVEDQATNTDKIYIPNHLFTTLDTLVKEAEVLGSNLTHSAHRSTDAAVHKLNTLGNRLAESAREPAS